ncbi:hypothetical protein TrCOL_g10459 [Triparma columacea]|uniref:Uncharacterized protein n=1 Tax=Triparma columacea TaxID=722753 RepID=A0A9W7G8M3_9STRA|nr:hypothetical protein TrCOL_g10459 [Triparma columacea]
MAKGKGGQSQKKDKETKEQRKARLQAEKQSIEQCTKLLPYAGIFLLILTLLFCLYVNSVPPTLPSISPDPPQQHTTINLADYSLEELRDMAKKSGDDRFLEQVEKYAVQSGREGGEDGDETGEEEGETEEL